MEDTKRLTREEIREPDQVTNQLDHAFIWVRKHPRGLVGIAVGALSVGIAIAAVSSWRSSRDAAAGKALAAVVEIAGRAVGEAPVGGAAAKSAKASFADGATRRRSVVPVPQERTCAQVDSADFPWRTRWNPARRRCG